MFLVFPYLFLLLILCVVTITDLREKRIPDGAILIALFVKLAHSYIVSVLEEVSFLEILFGILIDGLLVSLPVLIIILLIEKILGKEAMGGGDIKLLFITGLYLGWETNLWILLLACVMGIAVGKKDYFSFGPFIALATFFCIVYGLIF